MFLTTITPWPALSPCTMFWLQQLQIRSAQHLGVCSLAGAARGVSTLSELLGAPPSQEGSSLPARPPQQSEQQQQPRCELPSLCGEPKNKLSLHRRGNRRVSYYVRRKELFAQCKFCGQTGMPHELLAVNKGCTGQCMHAPSKPYPREYKPPV